MKKRLFLILSVTAMLFAGCGNRDNSTADIQTETAGSFGGTAMAGEGQIPVATLAINGDAQQRQPGTETSRKTESGNTGTELSEAPATRPISQPEWEGETETPQASADAPGQGAVKPETPDPAGTAAEETQPEEPKPEMPEPEDMGSGETGTEGAKGQGQAAAAYSPVAVCSLAVAKCQAGGMVTTVDNLAAMLSEGRITQEEYNACYPYDGLGYYSVFVETDLNEAATTSGRKLGSEEGIADYIAGMMLLETEPVFYLEYAGVYSLNGTDFYEFRCYR